MYNEGAMQEVIPQQFLDPKELLNFVTWLRTLAMDREDKRQLLMLWADRVGTKLTLDMLTKAGIK